MANELDAARAFIKMCSEVYPEADLMDDATKETYSRSILIVRKAEIEQKKKEYYEQLTAEEYQERPPEKPKKKGKLAQFEDDVIECLKQGWGEEKQLLEEAYNRKNKWARINYIKAYHRAVNRFQRGE